MDGPGAMGWTKATGATADIDSFRISTEKSSSTESYSQALLTN